MVCRAVPARRYARSTLPTMALGLLFWGLAAIVIVVGFSKHLGRAILAHNVGDHALALHVDARRRAADQVDALHACGRNARQNALQIIGLGGRPLGPMPACLPAGASRPWLGIG